MKYAFKEVVTEIYKYVQIYICIEIHVYIHKSGRTRDIGELIGDAECKQRLHT